MIGLYHISDHRERGRERGREIINNPTDKIFTSNLQNQLKIYQLNNISYPQEKNFFTRNLQINHYILH